MGQTQLRCVLQTSGNQGRPVRFERVGLDTAKSPFVYGTQAPHRLAKDPVVQVWALASSCSLCWLPIAKGEASPSPEYPPRGDCMTENYLQCADALCICALLRPNPDAKA